MGIYPNARPAFVIAGLGQVGARARVLVYKLLDRGAQAVVRGGARELDRGGQAVARGGARCAWQILDLVAQAGARGAAR